MVGPAREQLHELTVGVVPGPRDSAGLRVIGTCSCLGWDGTANCDGQPGRIETAEHGLRDAWTRHVDIARTTTGGDDVLWRLIA